MKLDSHWAENIVQKEKMLVTSIYMPLKLLINTIQTFKPFPKRQILDSSKLKEFADNNFEFNENGRKFSKWEESTVGKGEIACYEQFYLFPVFSKDL